MAQLRPSFQPAGQPLHRLQRHQPIAELLSVHCGRLLSRRVCGQQQPGAQLHHPRRHHYPVTHLAQRQRRRRLLQFGSQLIDQRRQREGRQIDLLRARQRQKMVERTRKPLKPQKRRCPLPCGRSLFNRFL